jgi:hypothetical protein
MFLEPFADHAEISKLARNIKQKKFSKIDMYQFVKYSPILIHFVNLQMTQ